MKKTLAMLPQDMLEYACGNIERRMYANDGRRSTPTLEGSRLVIDKTQAQRARVFVRSEMGLQRKVSFIAQKVAGTNRRGSFGEDNQSFINWLFLPAVPRMTPFRLVPYRWHSLADTAFCYDNTSGKGLVGREYFMDDWNDWYASRETVRVPAVKLSQKPLTITGFIREIVRRYAAQDHVSEQDYLEMLILKDQYERRDRALLD